MSSNRTEIRITGFGGQGVILAGHIFGRACAVNAGMHATQIQSFGPEARGSACSTTLAVSPTEVLYPYIERPDVFVVMSSEGYDKYRDELKSKGTLVYEKDLVTPKLKKGQPSFGVSSTRIAENLGRSIVQNIVMVGFAAAATKLVPREAMRQAVQDSVPAGTEELNLRAFDAGWEAFEQDYGEAKPTKGKKSTKKKADKAATPAEA
ncbi:MAG: pyruvate ferredoxin oxidoreductase [bacterium]|nr:pyruvate ferredoxin oxidoreductase [bacterium]